MVDVLELGGHHPHVVFVLDRGPVRDGKGHAVERSHRSRTHTRSLETQNRQVAEERTTDNDIVVMKSACSE